MANNAAVLMGLAIAVSAAMLAGCTVHPHGEFAERQTAMEAGRIYERPVEQRDLPMLKADASPEELVRYALLANADVEAKYWAWRAALEQVPQAGTQKAEAQLSFETMIADGRSALEDTTLAIGNDAMNSLVLPSKLRTEAQAALEEARAAGRRFDAARFALRNRVLSAWYDYALTAEQQRLSQANTNLLEMMTRISESRVSTGASGQVELLKAGNEAAISRNETEAYGATLTRQRAAINALLNRAPDAALDVPASLPVAREPGMTDEELLMSVARNNPELQALARETEGKQDAIERAKLEYLPDFNVNFSTDLAGVTQSVMGSVVLPYLRHEAIDAGIRRAEANLRQAEAMRRQTRHDLAARVVADLAILRDSRRQAELLEKTLIPRAEEIITASRNSYASGSGSLLDLVDSQRSELSLRRMLAEMGIEGEKQVADLEEIAGKRLGE